MSRSNLLRLGLRVGYCRVAVTLAPATLDVLALALLDGQQDTRHNASHDSEEHAEIAQRKGLHIHSAHKSMRARFIHRRNVYSNKAYRNINVH